MTHTASDFAPGDAFTVEDIRRATDLFRRHDATTLVHGWDANGSPVEERVLLVPIHPESILGRQLREGGVF